MTQLPPSARPRRFPIAAKLGAGFLLALLLPTLFLSLLFFFARQDIDRTNIESYARQVGQRQRQSLVTTFDRGAESLERYAEGRESNQLLLGLLLQDIRITPTIPLSTADEVSVELRQNLLQTTPVIFEEVGLITEQGTVVAAAGDVTSLVYEIGTDVSQSLALSTLQDLRRQDPTQERAVVASQRGDAVIEVVQVVRLRDTDNIAGYLVGVVDVERAIEPTLSFVEETFPANSLLISDNGVVVSPAATSDLADLSQSTLAVERARQDETDYREYRLAGGTGEEVGGYYARVQGTPFVLVTQVPLAAVLRQPAAYFTNAGAFVLITGFLGLATIALVALYNQHLTAPLTQLQRAMRATGRGNYHEPVPTNRADEIGELARTFVTMRQQVEANLEELQGVAQERSRDMRTTQQISHKAVTTRNLQKLMDEIVNLIVERFPNIYHAQIFLLNQNKRYAILRASTGDAGQQLLSRGHRLAVGSLSVIGQATSQQNYIIARDTSASEVHKRNEFLPDTRSELAVPLIVGNQIIGALDVQSKDSETFTEAQIQVLQTVADQIAVGIENAQLYQESVRRVQSVQARVRNQTRRAWQDYMFENRTQRLVRQSGAATETDLDSLRRQALSEGAVVVGDRTENDTVPIAVPLRLKDQIIGVVTSELPLAEYNGNKLLLAQELTERLADSLDNTRLFEQSQRATERERLVNEISTKLTAQTDVNEILQMAVEEVGRALRAPQVSIRLTNQTKQPTVDQTE